MSKGIAAFVIVLSVIMAISMLSGIGYYSELRVNYDAGYNDDVAAAADVLVGQEASNTGSSVFTDFTVGGANALRTAWQVLANTSGVLQLLFGLPPAVADPLERFFQLIFGLTFAGFVRGVMVQ